MDLTVSVILISLYIAAIAAPIAIFAAARRTGQGLAWLYSIGLCTAIIWGALALGLLRDAFTTALLETLVDRAGVAAMVAAALLSVIALTVALRPWPGVVEADPEPARPAGLGKLATDIE
ncbi:MAG: hypothetical protein AAF914_01800 [Pseudomonadota bacterium]